jgi:nitrate reductase delta subunit
MNMTLKAMSALLSYPTTDLQAAADEIGKVVSGDRTLPAELRAGLTAHLAELAAGDIYDIEERYTALFDRSRTLSLNLFEHVHGESRARGSAMVSLVETYRAAGFEPHTSELPDHLPVLLEFLAHQPEAEAKDTLADAAHIFAAVHERLKRRDSSYAWVFAALLRLSGAKADAAAVAELLAIPDDDPDDLEALDAVWEESQVTFGPDPDAGCPAGREMLNKMAVPRNPDPAVAAE